jgi:D-alanyl-D-alanine endopeptidase (penicillin-binding protein 7)
MKLFGVVAFLVGVFCLTGLPNVAPANAASAAKSAKTSKAAKTAKTAAVPGARKTSRAASRAGSSKGTAAGSRASKTAAARAAGSAAKASTARAPTRASARNARAKSKTPRGAHTDRGAAAALAGAGIGAKAVKASLHQSAPETGGTPTIGEAIGLHRVPDPLALRSAVALVVDAQSGEVLYEKNSHAVLPIASITKVMMAMVVLDAKQSLEDKITIDESDRDTERLSSSKLPMGSTLTRSELLQLALMSSENRAASALARSYPGGLSAFVAAANRKAAEIGMRDSVFMDGTGLSSSNVSTARDLAVMVAHAARYSRISEYSTASDLSVRTSHGARVFRTTNRMVGSSDWDLSLQKTGYISESGNCLVMRGHVDGRSLILVLLDSYGRYSRLGDAQRIRRWLEG